MKFFVASLWDFFSVTMSGIKFVQLVYPCYDLWIEMGQKQKMRLRILNFLLLRNTVVLSSWGAGDMYPCLGKSPCVGREGRNPWQTGLLQPRVGGEGKL